jgi:hypothetical protein
MVRLERGGILPSTAAPLVRGKEEQEVISNTAELAKARQQEIEIYARRSIWRDELHSYRRRDGAMQILRLRRR